MSDLRHRNADQLMGALHSSLRYQEELRQKLNNQKVREEWIRIYLEQKTGKPWITSDPEPIRPGPPY